MSQWWNAPAGPQQLRAYYMTLRVHYGMPAAEAWDYAKRNADALGITRGGFIENLRRAIDTRED
jgi:hypothetical protein